MAAGFAAQNTPEPLDDRLSGSSLRGRLNEAMVESLKSAGGGDALYSIPTSANNGVLHYRTDLFEAAGLDAPHDVIDGDHGLLRHAGKNDSADAEALPPHTVITPNSDARTHAVRIRTHPVRIRTHPLRIRTHPVRVRMEWSSWSTAPAR